MTNSEFRIWNLELKTGPARILNLEFRIPNWISSASSVVAWRLFGHAPKSCRVSVLMVSALMVSALRL